MEMIWNDLGTGETSAKELERGSSQGRLPKLGAALPNPQVLIIDYKLQDIIYTIKLVFNCYV